MPNMLYEFWKRSDKGRTASLEREAIRLLKARRLAQEGYMKKDGQKSLQFLNLVCDAEEKLDQVANELLELEK